MARYKKDECAWFYTSRDPFFELSNMGSGFPICHRGIEWYSTEHLYQASKYAKDAECVPENSTDPNIIANVRERIRTTKNCMAAKMTQKCAVLKGLVRSDWHTQNINNMRFVLELKVLAHYNKINKILYETLGRDIVEVSKNDTFWGCQQRYSQKGTVLVGENHLGLLWMDIRDRLEEIMLRGFAVEPDNFFLD